MRVYLYFIINALYNYYISNKVLLAECDKEENVEVTVAGSNSGCCYFLLKKKIVKRFAQCHVFAQSPPGRRPIDKYPVNTSHRSRFV
jgi:hypothetical protein